MTKRIPNKIRARLGLIHAEILLFLRGDHRKLRRKSKTMRRADMAIVESLMAEAEDKLCKWCDECEQEEKDDKEIVEKTTSD